MDSVNKLIADVKSSTPLIGLQQFWLEKPSNKSTSLEFSVNLWNNVIFLMINYLQLYETNFLLLGLDVMDLSVGNSASLAWYSI